MNRYLRRAAVGSLISALVLVGGAVPATAQVDLTLLRSSECHAFNPSGNDDVPEAWHLDRLDMETAWTMATGRGVTVAVIDTGVSPEGSPYFTADRITTYDLQGGMSQKDHDQGGIDCLHGTQVTGILAAGRSNGRPVDVRTNFAGIAPDSTVLSYRVLTASAQDQDSAIVDPVLATITAIEHAVDEGARVINLSQTVPSQDPGLPALEHAISEAIRAGVVVVAAAGNEGESVTGPAYPAAFDGVISVGMTMRGDAPSVDSRPVEAADAPQVTIGAPGAGVMSIVPSPARPNVAYTNQAYATDIQGTSFAAPIVAGVAALLLERNPDLSPEEIKTLLVETADPPSNTAPGARLGFGIVNPVRALAGVGTPRAEEGGSDVVVVAPPLPEPVRRDMTTIYAGIGIGIGAVLLAGVGLVAALVVPAARRRADASSAKGNRR